MGTLLASRVFSMPPNLLVPFDKIKKFVAPRKKSLAQIAAHAPAGLPEGYISARETSTRLNISLPVIYKACQKRELDSYREYIQDDDFRLAPRKRWCIKESDLERFAKDRAAKRAKREKSLQFIPDGYCTVQQVADELSVSYGSILQRISSGEIKSQRQKIGDTKKYRHLIPREDVESLQGSPCRVRRNSNTLAALHGYRTTSQAAQDLGVTRTAVIAMIRTRRFKPKKQYYSGDQNAFRYLVSINEINRVKKEKEARKCHTEMFHHDNREKLILQEMLALFEKLRDIDPVLMSNIPTKQGAKDIHRDYWEALAWLSMFFEGLRNSTKDNQLRLEEDENGG